MFNTKFVLKINPKYCPYSSSEDEKRFVKIFELHFEISERADLLGQVVKGSYFV